MEIGTSKSLGKENGTRLTKLNVLPFSFKYSSSIDCVQIVNN
ncbi:hypothetical protein ACQ5SI_26255 [Peribacillus frigoritolerans]